MNVAFQRRASRKRFATNRMVKTSIPIVILTFCLAVALTEVDVRNAIQECQDEQGLADVESLMMERSMTLKDENNEKGRCFIDCLMKKFGIYKNGVLDVDAVLEQGKEIIQYAKNKDFG
ncbi:hypothetical protein C0J52_24059 [Blattella germanica]|nr:hypothetical protein C0J52_24059 [Blattella germanica]